MRRVFANPGKAAAKGALARQRIVANFTEERVAGMVEAELRRIELKLSTRVRAGGCTEDVSSTQQDL